MPSTLTHYVFNKQLIKDDKYRDIFLLGGQGADVFFFYGYNIAKRENGKKIRKLGFDIHKLSPQDIYFEMLKYAFSKSSEEKEILINFTRGFMYHYALDRTLHPYVFYNTGFPYTTPVYNRNHGNFESILDTLLMKEYGETISTRRAIKANKKQIQLCSIMLSEVLKKVLNVEIINDESYYKSYKDFRFVRLIIDSKYGVKKSIFNCLLKNNSINIASQPHKVKDDELYDYLNKNHKTWVIPATGNKSNFSVKDLFEKAKEDTRIIDTIIYNFKDNLVTKRKIEKFVNNINHDGHDINESMTYFKVIWNKEQNDD